MKYPALKELKDKEIRRLTGVKRSTFVKMVGMLCASYTSPLKTNLRQLY
jgi:hypothetical protein